MKTRLLGASALGAALLALAAPAANASSTNAAVFAQTDNLAGNSVVVYDRAGDGTLTEAHSYPTGGLGGQLSGSVADHLGSQESLVYDRSAHTLLAVNAGSNTVAVFAVFGDRLALRQDISSGGSFPASIAVHGDLVYVLNAEAGGSLQAFRLHDGRLAPLGEATALNLPEAAPQFVNTPGEVVFSPSGRQLFVTGKATTNTVLAFRVGARDHSPGRRRTRRALRCRSEPAFDRQGHLLVVDAGGQLGDYSIGKAAGIRPARHDRHWSGGIVLGRIQPRVRVRVECR